MGDSLGTPGPASTGSCVSSLWWAGEPRPRWGSLTPTPHGCARATSCAPHPRSFFLAPPHTQPADPTPVSQAPSQECKSRANGLANYTPKDSARQPKVRKKCAPKSTLIISLSWNNATFKINKALFYLRNEFYTDNICIGHM